MRYQKQEKIIGKNAQEVLHHKKVLIVGMGALGSVISELMVRAGVGTLYIMDGDLVEETNLHRQQLYAEKDAQNEQPKVFTAEQMLKSINSDCTIIPLFEELHKQNAQHLIDQVDLVMDGTDNLKTRYLINDHCFQLGTPWIYGAASGTTGTYFTFIPKKTPCFRCLFGDIEELEGANCSTQGVLPSITHYVATMQFNEAIKFLTGHQHLLNQQLERIDLWHNQHMKMTVQKRQHCVCQRPQTNSKKERAKETFDLKTLCGKDIIMARINRDECAETRQVWLQRKLDEKNIPYTTTPYFQTAIIQGTKIRLFQDGRIYFYHTHKEQAKDILTYWTK